MGIMSIRFPLGCVIVSGKKDASLSNSSVRWLKYSGVSPAHRERSSYTLSIAFHSSVVHAWSCNTVWAITTPVHLKQWFLGWSCPALQPCSSPISPASSYPEKYKLHIITKQKFQKFFSAIKVKLELDKLCGINDTPLNCPVFYLIKLPD